MAYQSSPPVKNTCPDIDGVLKSLKSAVDYINAAVQNLEEIERLTDETTPEIAREARNAKANLGEAESYINCSDELEYLRSANEALRGWGYDLVKEVEYLEAQ